jgi:hypothetical protein
MLARRHGPRIALRQFLYEQLQLMAARVLLMR